MQSFADRCQIFVVSVPTSFVPRTKSVCTFSLSRAACFPTHLRPATDFLAAVWREAANIDVRFWNTGRRERRKFAMASHVQEQQQGSRYMDVHFELRAHRTGREVPAGRSISTDRRVSVEVWETVEP